MDVRLKGDWYIERLTRDEIHGHLVSRRVARIKTPFQTAEVVDTLDYGRVLFIDGLVQSAEVDEFIYHESLIHPALLLHPEPRRVFIGGGAEGANLREVLKHPSIREIVMVEIDEQVVRLARKHLWSWHRGTYDDPRVKLHYEDALAFLKKDDATYDGLFLDLTDPGEGGPAQKLFTVEFYRLIRSRLAKNGLAVIQAGSANLNMSEGFTSVYQSLKKTFKLVLPYVVSVPVYVGPWAFFLTGNEAPRGGDSDGILARRFKSRKLKGRTRFYEPAVHRAAFTIPPYYRDLLDQGHSISGKNPLLMKRG
jgi:spermidine synthase